MTLQRRELLEGVGECFAAGRRLRPVEFLAFTLAVRFVVVVADLIRHHWRLWRRSTRARRGRWLWRRFQDLLPSVLRQRRVVPVRIIATATDCPQSRTEVRLIVPLFLLTKTYDPDFHSRRDNPYTHTHTRQTALCRGLPRSAGTRKVKPIWILLKQETVSGSGISWAICKSAPRSWQIIMLESHCSSFLQAGCPSCCPTNSIKALKAQPLGC